MTSAQSLWIQLTFAGSVSPSSLNILHASLLEDARSKKMTFPAKRPFFWQVYLPQFVVRRDKIMDIKML